MKAPQLVLLLVGLAALAGAAYYFLPGASRKVDTTIDSIQQKELEENWEYYYDREIDKLEAKLVEFRQQQVETIAQAISLENEILDRKGELDRADQLVRDAADEIKAAKAVGSSSVRLLDRDFELAEAEDQLRSWLVDRNQKRDQYERLASTLERAETASSQEMAVFEKATAQIEALRREKDFMASQLEINEIEGRLRALEEVSTAWFDSDSPGDLQQVRGVIEDRLLHDEAARRLVAEEGRIDSQFGLGEALERSSQEAANAAVESELRALLGDS
jgi:hypothetical protein